MYIAFDTETGGLDPAQYSLLTLYVAILDEEFNIIDELDLKIAPSGPYRVSASAMNVNKIDIVQHEIEADGEDVARGKLSRFILDNYTACIKKNGTKLTPIGHEVMFDIGFIKHFWPQFDSYLLRSRLDTKVIARFLQFAGKLPLSVNCSLESLAKHFGLEHKNAHNAKADTLMTVSVLRKLRELV